MANGKKTRKVGRPPLPKGQARGKIVLMRLSPGEATAFEKAAKASRKSLSEWMRSTLNAKINANA